MKIKVPKCKTCDYHRMYPRGKKQHLYFCAHSNVLTHYKIPIAVVTKIMYAKEAQTSPKWCPLRKV
jgi:hypothetical protein